MCENNSVWKIEGLPKTIDRALPYGAVWVDKMSPFLVSGVVEFGTDFMYLHSFVLLKMLFSCCIARIFQVILL